MGMTIDEAGNIIDRYDVNFYDDDGHKIDVRLLAQAFDTALETMRKYRKIEIIWDKWHIDMSVKTNVAMSQIGDVLKDGNND